MQDAATPQTDRELLLSLDQKFESFVEKTDDRQERTVKALEALVSRFEKFEETKFNALSTRVSKIEEWKQKMDGGWKVLIIVATVLSAIGATEWFKGLWGK